MKVADIIPGETYRVRRKVKGLHVYETRRHDRICPAYYPGYTEFIDVQVVSRDRLRVTCRREVLYGVSRDPKTWKVTWGKRTEEFIVMASCFEYNLKEKVNG